VVTAEDTAALAATFNAHRTDATATTVALLVVRTTEGLPLEDFTHAVASAWSGGGARSRGALIVFVMDTHQSRIEVGRGLEAELTDIEARRILDGVRPLLRSGATSTAMRRVGEDVVAETGGVPSPRAPVTRHAPAASTDDDTALYLIAFVVGVGLIVGLLVWYVSRQRERRYSYGNGGWASGYGGSSGGDTFLYVDNSSYYGGGGSSSSSGRSSGGYSSSWSSDSTSTNSWISSDSGGSFDGGGGSSDW
jgi:uncharacterized protein